MFTTRQGPLVQGEWRHRLVNGAYSIRASGIFQLDKDAYAGTPGDRSFRGDVNSQGQFRLSDKWVFGWDGTLITDKSYYQDYGFYKTANANRPVEDDAGPCPLAGLSPGPRRAQLFRYARDVFLRLLGRR